MKELIPPEVTAYHLQNYAILEKPDGLYEYVGWDKDDKSEKLSWIRGRAAVVEDILCLGSITAEGAEEEVETKLELDYELQKLPNWDKSKYFCVVLAGTQASLLKACDTGDFVKKGTTEYEAAQDALGKHGVTLPSDVSDIG